MTTASPTNRSPQLPLSRVDFAKLLWCAPFVVMLSLLVIEAALSAATTYFVIQTSRDVANDEFKLADLGWILAVQASAYVVGAISWVFAEQAGFGAFGRYMHRFAKHNKSRTLLFGAKDAREAVEPFLTNEGFHIFFELMYELEADLKLVLLLIFNAIVLGMEIDSQLPIAYALIFVICIGMQVSLRKRVTAAYLGNQQRTNALTAHTYTAWDNIFSGNRYNYGVWNREFKTRLRAALKAQIRAIVTREGLSSASGVISLVIIFGAIVLVAAQNRGDTAVLIALAATLPRQIDLAHSVLGLAEGWNDLLAIWTRIGGAVEHFSPDADADFNRRIRFKSLRLTSAAPNEAVSDPPASIPLPAPNLDSVLHTLHAMQHGRINVRGGNGSGKSSLLAALKASLGASAYFWPTTDKLAFKFPRAIEAKQAPHPNDAEEATDDDSIDESPPIKKFGFSAGEWQIRTLKEIVERTQARYYFLDEWDANLDATNKALAESLIAQLSARAVVVEISHRDAGRGSG
ncbi:MAG: ABC transporter ATP-binding protein [Betaproteobacteria bacterium]|nr:MAG: ABC transporter ATP-binding protein [Betaproteobacteria bacterium]